MVMQLPWPAPHGCVGSHSEWQRESGTPSPLSGKNRHSALAPHAPGSSTHAAPSDVPPLTRQNAAFETCVTPAVSGACAVQVEPVAQSLPNGVQVALQVPAAGAVSTQEVFGRVQSASLVQGSSTIRGASAAASPLLPLDPLVPLDPLLPEEPLLPLLAPPSGSELQAIASAHPPRPHARATRRRIRRA